MPDIEHKPAIRPVRLRHDAPRGGEVRHITEREELKSDAEAVLGRFVAERGEALGIPAQVKASVGKVYRHHRGTAERHADFKELRPGNAPAHRAPHAAV